MPRERLLHRLYMTAQLVLADPSLTAAVGEANCDWLRLRLRYKDIDEYKDDMRFREMLPVRWHWLLAETPAP